MSVTEIGIYNHKRVVTMITVQLEEIVERHGAADCACGRGEPGFDICDKCNSECQQVIDAVLSKYPPPSDGPSLVQFLGYHQDFWECRVETNGGSLSDAAVGVIKEEVDRQAKLWIDACFSAMIFAGPQAPITTRVGRDIVTTEEQMALIIKVVRTGNWLRLTFRDNPFDKQRIQGFLAAGVTRTGSASLSGVGSFILEADAARKLTGAQSRGNWLGYPDERVVDITILTGFNPDAFSTLAQGLLASIERL